MSRFIPILILSLACTFSATTFADTIEKETLSTYVGGTVTTTGLAAGGLILLTVYAGHQINGKKLTIFIRNNRTDLQTALQTGSGDVIEDLASILQIPKSIEKRIWDAITQEQKSAHSNHPSQIYYPRSNEIHH